MGCIISGVDKKAAEIDIAKAKETLKSSESNKVKGVVVTSSSQRTSKKQFTPIQSSKKIKSTSTSSAYQGGGRNRGTGDSGWGFVLFGGAGGDAGGGAHGGCSGDGGGGSSGGGGCGGGGCG
jgi:hypothetical protein